MFCLFSDRNPRKIIILRKKKRIYWLMKQHKYWFQAFEFRDSKQSLLSFFNSVPLLLSSLSKRLTSSSDQMSTGKLTSNFSLCSQSQNKRCFFLVSSNKCPKRRLISLACFICLFLYQLLVPIIGWPGQVRYLP